MLGAAWELGLQGGVGGGERRGVGGWREHSRVETPSRDPGPIELARPGRDRGQGKGVQL